jgi:hypothetical protein
MKTLTATDLRKELFHVIEAAIRKIPTRIRYKKKDAVILSYEEYRELKTKAPKKKTKKSLKPLIKGKILRPLNKEADQEIMDYMGL